MKSWVLFFLFLSLIITDLAAQDRIFVKLYQNTDLVRRIEVKGVNSNKKLNNVSVSSLKRISLGVSLSHSMKWNHEVEISFLGDIPPIEHELRVSEVGNLKNKFYSLHYELSKPLSDEDSRLTVLLGAGIEGYWGELYYDRSIDNIGYFDYYHRNRGVLMNFIPRLAYRLNSRFNLEISSKVRLFDFRSYKHKVLNPTIPEELQISDRSSSVEFFESAYNFRLGLSYRVK